MCKFDKNLDRKLNIEVRVGYQRGMEQIERTVRVDTPAERVWSYLSDFRSTNDWDPGTVTTVRTSGEGGPGTTYHNTSSFLGRQVEVVYTVLEVEDGRRILLQGENDSVTTYDTITVEPAAGGGAVVTYRAEFVLHGLAKVADPFTALPARKLGDDAEKNLQQTLDAL